MPNFFFQIFGIGFVVIKMFKVFSGIFAFHLKASISSIIQPAINHAATAKKIIMIMTSIIFLILAFIDQFFGLGRVVGQVFKVIAYPGHLA